MGTVSDKKCCGGQSSLKQSGSEYEQYGKSIIPGRQGNRNSN